MTMLLIDIINNYEMETRQLEYFVAVAEELSFSRAAVRSFAVQSTISAAISSLEKELGARLFERSTKRVALTVAGAALLPEARAAIEAIDRVRSSVAETAEGIRGRLRVGIFTNLFFLDLPRLFGEYHSHYPLVDLQLAASPSGSTGLAEDVRRGRVDVAFMGLPAEDLPGLAVQSVSRSPLVVVLPFGHPLVGRRAITLADLAREAFVDAPAGFGNRVAVDRAFAAAGLTRDVRTEVADLGEIPLFVAAGLGVAIMPEITVRLPATATVVPLEGDGILWPLSVITRIDPSPAASALLALLDEVMRTPMGTPTVGGGTLER